MRDSIDVFIGSPAEIVATLIERGRTQVKDASLLFCSDIEKLPVILRPAIASDAAELVAICSELGLEMSERTAHRILAGQIASLVPLLDRLVPQQCSSLGQDQPIDLYQDRRGLKLSTDDLSAFSRELEKAFAIIAHRYYIELSEEPIIRVGKDAINVKFPFDKEL